MLISEYYNKKPALSVVSALNYISDLANTCNKNIASWDIDLVFKEGDEIVLSPREINKRFFSRIKELEEKLPVTNLTPDQLSKLKACENRLRESHQKQLRQRISVAQNEITAYNTYIQERIKTLAKLHLDKESNKFSLDKIFSEIQAETFFRLHQVETDVFQLITPDIVLSDKHRPSGLDIRLNLGQFCIDFEPLNSHVTVHPFLNNVYFCYDGAGQYSHPFIARNNGKICWGDGANTAASLLAQREFTGVFKLLQSLLTTYPGGQPYCSLTDMWIHGRNRDLNQPWKSESDEPARAWQGASKYTLAEREAGLPEEAQAEASDNEPFCDFCDESGSHSTSEHVHECGDCGSEYVEADGHECSTDSD